MELGGSDRALGTGHLSQNSCRGAAVVECSIDGELIAQVLALPVLGVHEREMPWMHKP
jgi:hypothetical protein